MNKFDWLLAVTVVLILTDGVMALPFWHLEGNPVVVAIGPYAMIAVKAVASLALCGVWYSLGRHRTGTGPVLIVSFLFAGHAIVLVTNLLVLL